MGEGDYCIWKLFLKQNFSSVNELGACFLPLFFLTSPFLPAARSDRVQMRSDLAKINKVITEHTNYLAPYQFLTAFSQLISRICHSHDEVFVVLMEMIAKVFLAYPQQAMWMMTAVSKVLCDHNSGFPLAVALVIECSCVGASSRPSLLC